MSITAVKSDDLDNLGFWFDRVLNAADSKMLHTAILETAHQYAAGHHINYEGDSSHSIYFVLSGWVSLYKTMPNGHRQIVDFGLAGDFGPVLGPDTRTSIVGLDVVKPATIATIPLSLWASLEQSTPGMSKVRVLQDAAVRSRLAGRMLRLGRGSAEEVMAYAILELGVRSGAVRSGHLECCNLPLTQQQLGEFVGLSSVHVCRTLRRMARQGLISTNGHIDVRVLRQADLEDLAGISITDLARDILPYLETAVPIEAAF